MISGHLSSEELLFIVREVFYTYSVKGSHKKKLIQLNKYLQLLSDSNILSLDFNQNQAELIFCSVNKHRASLDYETFLEALNRISAVKYSYMYQDSPKNALMNLLQNHILPLFEGIGDKDSYLPESEMQSVFKRVLTPLKDIYSLYFPWETAGIETESLLIDRSYKAVRLLCREFNIVPSLLSYNQLESLWSEIVISAPKEYPSALALLPNHTHDLGNMLTFSKFLLLLYKFAELGFSNDTQLMHCTVTEKTLVLLERMELAKGVRNSKPRTNLSCLIPPKSVISSMISSPSTEAFFSINSSTRNIEELDYNIESLLEKHLSKLSKIYQFYCSYGEPMNTNRMKAAKLVKMLQDCDLVHPCYIPNTKFTMDNSSSMETIAISKVDVDIIFSRLSKVTTKNRARSASVHSRSQTDTEKHKYGRLDFRGFIRAIGFLSKKIFTDISGEEACIMLVEQYLFKLIKTDKEEKSNVNNLMELLKDNEIIEALSIINESIQYYYLEYADIHGSMNFAAFIDFCKDFSIFPDLISKSRLFSYFRTLSSIYIQTKMNSHESNARSSNTEIIDQYLLVEALALISLEVGVIAKTPLEKICVLMERMNQSPGMSKALKKKSKGRIPDLVEGLRQRYAFYFNQHLNLKRRHTFIDLIK